MPTTPRARMKSVTTKARFFRVSCLLGHARYGLGSQSSIGLPSGSYRRAKLRQHSIQVPDLKIHHPGVLRAADLRRIPINVTIDAR